MKKLLLFFCLFFAATQASSQQARLATSFTDTGNNGGIRLIATGIAYSGATWTKSGTVTVCSFVMDSSVDRITWNSGDVLGATDCSTNGASAYTNVVANYVRVRVTSFTGTGTVNIVQLGYILNPTPNTTPAVTSGNVVVGTGTSIGDSGFPVVFNPAAYSFLFDDFTKSTTAAGGNFPGALFDYSGTGTGNTWTIPAPSDAGTYGIIQVTSGNASGDAAGLFLGPGTNIGAIYNTTTFDARFRVALVATTTESAFLGASNVTGFGETGSYIGIAYDTTAGDTNWMCVTSDGTATRTAITGATLDTSYHVFRIRATTAGTIKCSVDGGTEISIATHVPTASITPSLQLISRTAATRSFKVDYFWQLFALTR